MTWNQPQPCRCCMLQRSELSTTGVCRLCWGHASDGELSKSRVHFDMWRASNAQMRKRFEDQIAALSQLLEERPEKIVTKYLDADVLEEAQTEAQRAFRSRERAWQGLVEVRLLHREGERGQCRCGLPLDRCKVAAIVEQYSHLDDWELEQVRRLRRYETHALPSGHPALIDPRWRHPAEDVDDGHEDDAR